MGRQDVESTGSHSGDEFADAAHDRLTSLVVIARGPVVAAMGLHGRKVGLPSPGGPADVVEGPAEAGLGENTLDRSGVDRKLQVSAGSNVVA